MIQSSQFRLSLGTRHIPGYSDIFVDGAHSYEDCLVLMWTALSIWSSLMTQLLDQMSAKAVSAKKGVPWNEHDIPNQLPGYISNTESKIV